MHLFSANQRRVIFFMYIIITDVLRRPRLLSTCFITYIVGVKQEIFFKSQALGSISNFRPCMKCRNTTQLQFKIEVVHRSPTLRGSGSTELSSSFWCYTAIQPYRQKLFVIQESLSTGSGLLYYIKATMINSWQQNYSDPFLIKLRKLFNSQHLLIWPAYRVLISVVKIYLGVQMWIYKKNMKEEIGQKNCIYTCTTP